MTIFELLMIIGHLGLFLYIYIGYKSSWKSDVLFESNNKWLIILAVAILLIIITFPLISQSTKTLINDTIKLSYFLIVCFWFFKNFKKIVVFIKEKDSLS